MPKIKFVQAAPNETSGINLNTPIRKYDTHPNQYFELGDRVMPLDWEEPPITGEVIGHVAEDRLVIDWGRVVSQEDVDDLVKMDEYVGQTARSRVPTRHGSREAYYPGQNWYRDYGPDKPNAVVSKRPQQTNQPRVNYPGTQAPTQQAPTQQAPTQQAPTQQAPTQQAPTQQAPTQQAPTQQAPTQQAPTQQAHPGIKSVYQEYYNKYKDQVYNPLLIPAIQEALGHAGMNAADIEDLAEFLGGLLKNTKGWTPGMRHAASSYVVNKGLGVRYPKKGTEDHAGFQAMFDQAQSKYGEEYNPLRVQRIQGILREAGLNARTISILAAQFDKMKAAYTEKYKKPWQPKVDTEGLDQTQASPQASPQGPTQGNPPQAPGEQGTLGTASQNPMDQMLANEKDNLIGMLSDSSFLESLQQSDNTMKVFFIDLVEKLKGIVAENNSNTYQVRTSALNDLLRVADLTEQVGMPDAAESFRAAAVVAKSVSELYNSPETREASRDATARSALLGARDLVLQTTNDLRSTQDSALRVAADLAELHFAVSALYPNKD